ncbi:MAG: ribonuclease P protein component [Pseudomonadota bacterium]
MPRFPKSRRLLKPVEFGEVKRRGVCARAGVVSVAWLGKDGVRRLGIVASRRAGNAVERNRLKRVIREFFRMEGCPFPMGDCVVVLAPGAGAFDNFRIRADLGRALEKIKWFRSCA